MTRVPVRWPLRVYYDGACPACAAATARFRRSDVHARLDFVDIADPAFDPAAEGLARAPIEEAMHARDAAGRLVAGVDALLAVAAALPSLWWLRGLGRVPGFGLVARPLYHWFARRRHALTGRCAHASCSPDRAR